MRTRTMALTVLATALVCAGCGGDDAGSSTSSADAEPVTAEEAKQAYRDFYAALHAGDAGAVCGVLTEAAATDFVEAAAEDESIAGDDCEEVATNTSELMQSFGTGDPKIRFGTFGVGSAGDAAIEATVADGPTRMIPVERVDGEVRVAGFGD